MQQLTRKQFSILDIIVTGNPQGVTDTDKLVSLDEILERIPYATSKASMQFSIRSMIDSGYIQKLEKQKRDGRSRTLFSATKVGLYRMNPEALATEGSFIVSEEEDDIFGDYIP